MSILSLVSLGRKWPQERPQTMLMQNFGVTNKEYYGMLWYFLEWSNVTQQRIVDDEEIDFEQSLFFLLNHITSFYIFARVEWL